ncbi:hypothetical protein CVT25_010103 [Psilocybe cyanescens]|uniref:Uncharacterized protein n=1 Tax=Psilocybe cyanescens TaxID=93625 RepID=A0A409X386_PSICY|nr:hypothetical protein CVT25_010103 [Psilocybe cyanescens]
MAVGAWFLLPAFYVLRSVMGYHPTPKKEPLRNFPMGKMHGLGLSMGASSPMTTKRSVSASISMGLTPHVFTAPHVSTSAPFVAQNPTTPSHTHADPGSSEFWTIARPPHLFYPDFTLAIALRPSFSPSIHVLPDIFSRVITPYSPAAFHALLAKYDLTPAYPLLVHNLNNGFPLGPMPPLNSTHIMTDSMWNFMWSSPSSIWISCGFKS